MIVSYSFRFCLLSLILIESVEMDCIVEAFKTYISMYGIITKKSSYMKKKKQAEVSK